MRRTGKRLNLPSNPGTDRVQFDVENPPESVPNSAEHFPASFGSDHVAGGSSPVGGSSPLSSRASGRDYRLAGAQGVYFGGDYFDGTPGADTHPLVGRSNALPSQPSSPQDRADVELDPVPGGSPAHSVGSAILGAGLQVLRRNFGGGSLFGGSPTARGYSALEENDVTFPNSPAPNPPEWDIEAQAPAHVSADFNEGFIGNIQKRAEVSAVKQAAFNSALLDSDNKSGDEFNGNVQSLINHLKISLPKEEELNRNGDQLFDAEGANVTVFANSRQKVIGSLEGSFNEYKEAISELGEKHEKFMDYKARQAVGKTTLAERAQRHVMGNEPHAVFTRSAIQSITVVGATAGFQVATTKALAAYYNSDTHNIPTPVWDAAKSELPKGASDQQIAGLAIGGLTKPGSSYLDEATNTAPVIYGVEAGLGGIRGVLLPIADSQNESDMRKRKVEKTISGTKKILESGPQNTSVSRGQAFKEAYRGSLPAQMDANMKSGALAAAVASLAAPEQRGYLTVLEAGKTMMFSYVAAHGNAASDGARKALITADSPGTEQIVKGAFRVTARAGAQLAKTGLSWAQSAVLGSGMASRSVPADLISAGMTSLVSGSAKEALGSAFQYVSGMTVPPNEAAYVSSGKVLNAMGKLAAAVNDPSLSEDANVSIRHGRQTVNAALERNLTNAVTANGLELGTLEYDHANHKYSQELDDRNHGTFQQRGPGGRSGHSHPPAIEMQALNTGNSQERDQSGHSALGHSPAADSRSSEGMLNLPSAQIGLPRSIWKPEAQAVKANPADTLIPQEGKPRGASASKASAGASTSPGFPGATLNMRNAAYEESDRVSAVEPTIAPTVPKQPDEGLKGADRSRERSRGRALD